MGKLLEHDPHLVEYPIVKPQHVPAADGWYSMATLAIRWDCSVKHAQRVCERYRGEKGFQDQGIKETMHKRKSSHILIHATLLKRIEDDFRDAKR